MNERESSDHGEPAESAPARSRSRTLLAVAIALAFAVAILTVLGVVLNPPAEPEAGTGSARPLPSVSPSASALPTVEPSIIPADCAQIYTRDWAATMAPAVLNPEWALEQPSVASNDDALIQLLEPAIRLTCQWGSPAGGSDFGLITQLAAVDAHTLGLAQSRMNALGWACSEQWGGVRCVIEGAEESGSWGESHFLREGVWVATRWANLGPDGYTADIAQTLWR